jgi:hypothetical protein
MKAKVFFYENTAGLSRPEIKILGKARDRGRASNL